MKDSSAVPQIPKWPFYVADAVCVLAALVIGVRSDSAWAHFLVCALVIAGALVLMYPFLNEYNARTRFQRMDLREELEAQRAMLVSIATDSQAASRGVLQMTEHVRAVLAQHENVLAPMVGVLPALTKHGERLQAAAQVFEQGTPTDVSAEFTALKEHIEGLREQDNGRWRQTADELKKLSEQIDAGFAATADDEQAISPLKSDLEALRKDSAESFSRAFDKLQSTASQIAAMQAKSDETQATLERMIADLRMSRSVDVFPAAAAAPSSEIVQSILSSARAKPSVSGAGLLKKAFAQTAPSSAVARIIGVPKSEVSAEPSDLDDVDGGLIVEPVDDDSPSEQDDSALLTQENLAQDIALASAADTQASSDAESDSDQVFATDIPLVLNDPQQENTATQTPAKPAGQTPLTAAVPDLLGSSPLLENFEKVIKAKEAAKAARQTDQEDKRPFDHAAQVAVSAETPASPSSENLSAEALSQEPLSLEALAEATPSKPKVARKVRGQATSLTARLLIGIGNKPFIRGEGPGLSLEKGVAMDFVEIGVWRWVGKADSAYAHVRIYKNDEVPSLGEPLSLEAGQQYEAEPVF